MCVALIEAHCSTLFQAMGSFSINIISRDIMDILDPFTAIP